MMTVWIMDMKFRIMNILDMDPELVMNMTMFLYEGSRALTDINVSLDRLATRAVVVAFTSNYQIRRA